MGIALPQLAPASEDRVSGAQVIDGSLKFNGSDSVSLTRTVGSGNRTTWTWSAWVKTDPNQVNGSGGFAPMFFGGLYNTSGQQTHIAFGGSGGTSGQLLFTHYDSSYTTNLRSSSRYRDIGWYHIVVVFDSNNGTSGDRARVYVNGERVTTWASETYPSSGGTTWINDSSKFHGIGKDDKSATENCFDGAMSQVYFIDGQALGPESFGYTDGLTNTWRPKKYTGEFNFTVGTTNYTSISTLAALAGSTLNSSYNDVSKVFDGSGTGVRTVEETSNQGEKLSITFSPAITLSNQTVSIDTYSTYQGMFVTVGGADGSRVSGSDSNTTTLTTGSLSGSLSKITVDNGTDTSGRGASILRIRIGGSTLLNPVIGVNGFYLPMDGNSPIGEDKSGQGNNWTPVNFGGSVVLDNPQVSGARPILNTGTGGTVARPGVFGSELNQTIEVTVSNASGNNKYYLDGSLTPNLAFTRGSTITFNTGDSSGNGHPFKLSSTNASGSGGSEYTDGVAYYINGSVVSGSDYVTNYSSGAASGFRGIKWTVPHNQSTTYYYCTIHTGMGNNGAFTSTIDETKADPYAWKNVLALPLVGSANDVSNSVNSGSTTKAVTNYNSNAVFSSANSNFYNGSVQTSNANNGSADGSAKIIQVASNSDFAFSGDFTVETWIYATAIESYAVICGNYVSVNNFYIEYSTERNLLVGFNNTGYSGNYTAVANVWKHIAVTRSGSTLRTFVDGIETSSHTASGSIAAQDFGVGGYHNRARGLEGHIQDFRIYNGVAKYTSNFVVPATSPDILPDTPSGVSGGSKLIKVTDGAVSFDGSGDYLTLANSSDFVVGTGDFTMECYIYQKSQGGEATVFGLKHTGGSGWTGYKFYITTSGNFILYAEDAGSGDWDIGLQSGNGSVSLNRWHHLSATRNGTTFRVFVDGILKASTTSSVDLNDGGDGFYISNNGANQQYFNGIISNIRIIKGTALYTTDFTPPTRTLTNVTNTKLLCCQSPTSATEGVVKPGTITANGDAAATNFNPFNTDIDTVRGQETGYATLNPLSLTKTLTLSDGNLGYTATSAENNECFSNIRLNGGKFYFESNLINAADVPGSTSFRFGICKNLDGVSGSNIIIYNATGNFETFGTTDSSPPTYTAGNTIGVSVDCVNGSIQFFKDGVSVGTKTFTVGTDEWTSYIRIYKGGGNTVNGTINFGQKPFKFPPPDGFQPLNAANVRPETVISRPDQYVGVTTYTGDDAATHHITGLNFGAVPDFVWIKNIDQSEKHILHDTVRGIGNTLYSNNTDQADTGATYSARFKSFDFNGFTVGTNHSGTNSTDDFIAWCWKAGGNKNTFNVDDVGYASAAAAGLTGGSITPTGSSVGTRQGFSIIKYTGNGNAATIPHGLSQTPTFLIKKFISASSNWDIWTPNIGANKRLTFTNAATDSTTSYQNVNSTTFDVHAGGNDNTVTMIAYLWHDVPGLQKFGSYTGGGSSYPFIELGFSPAILMIKNASTGGTHYDWKIIDSTRNPFNLGADNADSKNVLFPNLGDAENKGGVPWAQCDFLSNGFRMNDQSVSVNNSGSTYVYAAWAEAPTFNLFGGQSNAF